MGGGGSTNTVQKSDPWEGQQQYLRDIFGSAQGLFNQGPIPFFGEAGTPGATKPTAPDRASFTSSVTLPGSGGSFQSTVPGYPNYGFPTSRSSSVFDSAGYNAAMDKYTTDLAAYNDYLANLQDPSTVKTLAPVAPETYQAQDLARGAVPGLTDLGNAGAAATMYGLNDAIDVRNNPFLSAAMSTSIQPMVNAFTDPGGVLNTIRDQFGTAGQYGSDRQALAVGTASGRLSDSIANVVSQMGSAAYDSGLQAQSRALALLPTTQQSLLTPATTLDAVGQQARQLEQDYINEAIRRYDYTTQAPWQNLAQFSSMVQGNYGGTATSSMDTPGTSPLNAALGGAALGYGAYAAGMLPAAVGAGAATGVGALAMLMLAGMQ